MLSPTATLMMRVPCCVLYSFAKSIAAMSLPAVVCSRCQAAKRPRRSTQPRRTWRRARTRQDGERSTRNVRTVGEPKRRVRSGSKPTQATPGLGEAGKVPHVRLGKCIYESLGCACCGPKSHRDAVDDEDDDLSRIGASAGGQQRLRRLESAVRARASTRCGGRRGGSRAVGNGSGELADVVREIRDDQSFVIELD